MEGSYSDHNARWNVFGSYCLLLPLFKVQCLKLGKKVNSLEALSVGETLKSVQYVMTT